MDGRRGDYVGINDTLVEDTGFRALPSAARLLLLVLRLSPEAGRTAFYRVHRVLIPPRTGLTEDRIARAEQALVDGGWIHVDGDIVWITNALRWNPGVHFNNVKHVKGVLNELSALPKTALMAEFIGHYRWLFDPYDDLADAVQNLLDYHSNTPPRVQPPAQKPRPQATAEAPTEAVKAVIDRLNERAGKKFTYAAARAHISARLDEGRTPEQFYSIIDKMSKAATDGTWGRDGKDMSNYLRPDTLWGSAAKFDKYLNWAAPAARPGRRDQTWEDVERGFGGE